jgi:E3 ubiquitin-protein ligase UBR2
VFTTKLDADPGREERKAEKFLFRPIETFMCHGEPAEVFRQLKQNDCPPVLCGKVFKVGEPTYSCR